MSSVSEPREANPQERAPSFEAATEMYQRAVVFTRDALRLYWTLSGPLTSAISVMDDQFYDPDVPLEPYCLQTEPLTWSSVAKSPLTEPKISSVTVGVDELDVWEEQWMEVHGRHAEPGPHNDEINGARFGSLADFDPDSDEEGPEHLLRCCGGDRPRKTKVSLVVNATEGYLTVHDYVSAVHPWLMSLREKILQASGDIQDNVPLPPDTRLMVACSSPALLFMVEEERWKGKKSKKKNLELGQQFEAWKKRKALEDQELWEQEQGW